MNSLVRAAIFFFIFYFFTCRYTAPNSQGLAMATYTWKMNHEVVRPLCFPHQSCQRGSPSEHEHSKLINLPKPSSLQIQVNSTAARTGVFRNHYTSHYHLMLCFTLHIFSVLSGGILSLCFVFADSTTKGVLIHDSGFWCSYIH